MQMTDADEEQMHKIIAREIYQMISAFSTLKKLIHQTHSTELDLSSACVYREIIKAILV